MSRRVKLAENLASSLESQSLRFYAEANHISGASPGESWVRIKLTPSLLVELVKGYEAPLKHAPVLPKCVWGGTDRSQAVALQTHLSLEEQGFFILCSEPGLQSVLVGVDELLANVQSAVANSQDYVLVTEDLDSFKALLDSEEELCFCDECGANYAPGGDGYDGLCPDCADTKCSED